MSTSDLQQIFDALQTYLLPLLLSCLRGFAALQIFPLFFWIRLTPMLRFALSLVLILPVFMAIQPDLQGIGALPAPRWIWLAAKETMLGMALGLLLGIPFWAAQAVGDILDVYRGANVANVSDPINASQTSVLGQAILLIALALFVAADGFLVLVQLYILSFGVWPIAEASPPLNAAALALFAKGLLQVMEVGLVVAAPMLLVMFFTEFATGFAARGSKLSTLNDISSTLKNAVFALLAPTYFLFMSEYVSRYSFAPIMEQLRLFSGSR